MQLETAQKISKLMLECAERLNHSVQLVSEGSDPKELFDFRKSVGNIMGQIYCDVLGPIYKEYPEIMPKELRRE
jgi:hypothetical protein